MQDEHHNHDQDRKENFIRRFLWSKFRFELVRESQAREVEIFRPLGLDSLASKIRFAAPERFWWLTRKILELENSVDQAALVDEVFEKLLPLPDLALRAVLSKPPNDLGELYKRASGTSAVDFRRGPVRVSMTVRTSAPNLATSFFARTGPMPFTKPLPRYRSITSDRGRRNRLHGACCDLQPVLFVPDPAALGDQPFRDS